MKKILFDNKKNIVSHVVKMSRVKAGLSQSELAAKLQVLNVNIDQQMISRIENNERFVTDYELACIGLVLSITPNEMLADFNKNIKQL